MGRFIVFDGLDGSGKATQTKLLADFLRTNGKKVLTLSYPRYDSVSSTFVKLYLNGQLGSRPEDTNAYAASAFFAMDRYISYRTEWQEAAKEPDTVILADRYTTANAVHQLTKLPREQWDAFLTWLWDFEYGKLGIPHPDRILYLEMRPDLARKLIDSRAEKTGVKKDIHEKDASYLDRCYEAAVYAAEKLGWTRIRCWEGDRIRSREEIRALILDALNENPNDGKEKNHESI